jgi:hypothetical protein
MRAFLLNFVREGVSRHIGRRASATYARQRTDLIAAFS